MFSLTRFSEPSADHLTRTRNAAQGGTPPNPVIVIPGVLGSKLVSDSDAQSVWGEWVPGFTDPASNEAAQLFGLPMAIGTPLDQLRSASQVDGVLGIVRGSMVGVPLKVTAYGDVMSAMGVESFSDTFVESRSEALSSGAEAFEFSYDWRRSLDESAIALQAFIHRATRFLQVRRNSSEPIRFNIVAHSMGGLLLRYFLQFGGQLLPYDGSGPRLNWGGAAYVDKAVIIGTPNAGAVQMLDRLVQGIPGNPMHPAYGPVLVGTFPSGYQLLPRPRHKPHGNGDNNILDADFWLSHDWGITASWLVEERARQLPGLSSPGQRLEVAEDHLRKCLHNAQVFHHAMDQPLEAVPDHLELHLFVGDAHRTPMHFSGERGDRQLRWTAFGPGDGTVLASSVRLDETDRSSPIPWNSITMLKSNHMGLVKDRQLLGQVLELLGRAGH
ncbi:lecithin:cholesterol acyltransferase [Marinobacterium mangrovicola]|uniref:Lecithin:cholesterol acyltransferase n=1 Tax=Marinobacterium mangrovicola TaxID=1476959 RepID=A0A4V2PEI9_9GAMM|nr:lecithin:cholesterol acyltransferase [Marinobacterium mangrovicola]